MITAMFVHQLKFGRLSLSNWKRIVLNDRWAIYTAWTSNQQQIPIEIDIVMNAFQWINSTE